MAEQDLTKDFKEFVELLNSHKVEYMIVGAWALAFHGEPRTTGDMDVFVHSTPENAKRIMAVLHAFGFGSVVLSEQDFCINGQIVQLGYRPNRIDIITAISGVEFDKAWPNRQQIVLDGITFVFLGVKDLIANKKASGRDQDNADVKVLEKLLSRRKDNKA